MQPATDPWHSSAHVPRSLTLLPSFPGIAAQSRGADPSIRTENYEPYLNPGRKLPVEVRSCCLHRRKIASCPLRKQLAWA